MNPRIKKVYPLPDYQLRLVFTNGEIKIFDAKPYLDVGVFKELRNPELFNAVRPYLGSISWVNGQDLCPDTLYMDSHALNSTKGKGRNKNVRKQSLRIRSAV